MSTGRKIAEIALLFGAFFFLLPFIPSNEGYVPKFGFPHFAAIILFSVSRAIRWNGSWFYAALESAAFAGFVFVLFKAQALLY